MYGFPRRDLWPDTKQSIISFFDYFPNVPISLSRIYMYKKYVKRYLIYSNAYFHDYINQLIVTVSFKHIYSSVFVTTISGPYWNEWSTDCQALGDIFDFLFIASTVMSKLYISQYSSIFHVDTTRRIFCILMPTPFCSRASKFEVELKFSIHFRFI